jgi:hypothetical protein
VCDGLLDLEEQERKEGRKEKKKAHGSRVRREGGRRNRSIAHKTNSICLRFVCVLTGICDWIPKGQET